jgi:hypothetical protein
MADAGPAPEVDPVAMGRLRDAALAEVGAQLSAPNPHLGEMVLPGALLDDGGT